VTDPFKKPLSPIAVVSFVAIGIVFVGLGLTLMNVRDNIMAFAGLAFVVGGIAMIVTNAYNYFKEKNDQ
jgi:hypothetical protein